MNGFARYGVDHVIKLGKQDLQALENILGDKQYMFGDTPTTVSIINELVYLSLNILINNLCFTFPGKLMAKFKFCFIKHARLYNIGCITFIETLKNMCIYIYIYIKASVNLLTKVTC